MGEVVVIEQLTLDGVMQGPGGPDEDRRDGFEYGGWETAGDDPVIPQVMAARLGDPWALLLGRVTYQIFAGYWPRQPYDNPFAEPFNRAAKFVASTTLAEPLSWRNSTLLKGDAADAVAGLKGGLDENLVVFGSGVLVRSLMRRDLIDELVLLVHPLVLGEGRRLFTEDVPPARYRLAGSATTGTGVIIATYRRA